MKKNKKTKIDDLTEFIDENGKKWIQTSTEDLFSVKEINEILDSVEKEKEEGEIVLARIDFQNVNKEYYEKVKELKQKVDKRGEIIKKLYIETKNTIDRKNKKLKELIDYIKKLHIILAYYKLDPEKIDKMDFLSNITLAPRERIVERDMEEETEKVERIGFTEVEEILLDNEGKETTKIEG